MNHTIHSMALNKAENAAVKSVKIKTTFTASKLIIQCNGHNLDMKISIELRASQLICRLKTNFIKKKKNNSSYEVRLIILKYKCMNVKTPFFSQNEHSGKLFPNPS